MLLLATCIDYYITCMCTIEVRYQSIVEVTYASLSSLTSHPFLCSSLQKGQDKRTGSAG